MKRKRMPFITFEGLDGSGLTTQAFELKKKLEEKGYEVYPTKEPTDGLIGSLIRGVLRKELMVDVKTLALLFAADRMLHVEKTINKFLNSGIIVISDRYRLSSYAYQSIEVDLEWVKRINEHSIAPDISFLIDVPPLVCVRRMQKQRFHMELYENEEKLGDVGERFIELAKEEKNVFIIDGNRPKEVVAEDVFKKIVKSGILEGFE